MNGVLGHFFALSRLNWAGDKVYLGDNNYTNMQMHKLIAKISS